MEGNEEEPGEGGTRYRYADPTKELAAAALPGGECRVWATKPL